MRHRRELHLNPCPVWFAAERTKSALLELFFHCTILFYCIKNYIILLGKYFIKGFVRWLVECPTFLAVINFPNNVSEMYLVSA